MLVGWGKSEGELGVGPDAGSLLFGREEEMPGADAAGPAQGAFDSGVVGLRIGLGAGATGAGGVDDDVESGRQARPVVGLQVARGRAQPQPAETLAGFRRTHDPEDWVSLRLGLQRESRADVATAQDGNACRRAPRGKRLAIHSAGVEPAEAESNPISSAASASACWRAAGASTQSARRAANARGSQAD